MLSNVVSLPHVGHAVSAVSPAGLPRPVLVPLLLLLPCFDCNNTMNASALGFGRSFGLRRGFDDGSDSDAATRVDLPIFAASRVLRADLVMDCCRATLVGGAEVIVLSESGVKAVLDVCEVCTTDGGERGNHSMVVCVVVRL
jgi:hypothetical protein